MRIPQVLKVGGLPYKVEITENISLGRANYDGEIDYQEQKIRVVPAALERMESTFLHEVVHALFSFLGYSEHDEKKVDELANALYMLIRDNPEMFKVGAGDE
jgi:hypothetical protein